MDLELCGLVGRGVGCGCTLRAGGPVVVVVVVVVVGIVAAVGVVVVVVVAPLWSGASGM